MMREIGMSIPDFFTCPISLDLFSDPVTLCTGQTYDRPSIEKWLTAGNFTCPVTMLKLHDVSMVPNHTLRHLIDQWVLNCNTHQFHDEKDDFCKVGSSKVVFFSSLKHVLESQESTLEQKLQVLEQVNFLSEDFALKNEGLIQMGFFSLILGLIFREKISQEMMGLVEKLLDCALKMMSFSYLGDLNMLMEEAKFENFKVLIQQGSYMVKISLCNIIEVVSLQSSLATKELATKIGNDNTMLQILIGYIDDHKQHSELSEAGIKAILSLLSSSQEARRGENLVKQGLVHTLVTYIMEVERKKDNMELGPKATRALELVLKLESGKEAFLVKEVPNGVKALIKMVFRVSGDDEGSESAVNCLMILCCESLEIREEAICAGILTQLLLLLQSQCSGRAKTRARMLLKLLRSMWSKDPKHV
ncbi:hypothetical protein BVRB_6g132670 [Beta vulgaris subsp. vulgaris]|nr:hypothetical protein BVRB_6g132670 [Beta vulgaris subsp. vulgaris]